MQKTLIIIIFSIVVITAKGQSFSSGLDTFKNDVLKSLRQKTDEASKKVAYDFSNLWNEKFTSEQKVAIRDIAIKMKQKGYKFYPYFYHYYCYLTYSLVQEGISTENLNKLLEINKHSLETLSKSSYKNFLYGLNLYFGRRFLSVQNNLSVRAPNGTYSFKLIDDIPLEASEIDDIVNDTPQDVNAKEADEITSYDDNKDVKPENNDDWGDSSDDDWGDSSDDDWGDSSDDDWGDSSDDDWGDSSDDDWRDSSNDKGKDKVTPSRFIPSALDRVALLQSRYRLPKLEGPIISLNESDIIISTPHDTLKILNTVGEYLLKDRSLIASQGTFEWPKRQSKFKGAKIKLGNFYIKKNRADFKTPYATLNAFGLINKDVEGVLEYRIRKNDTPIDYPVFTSNHGGIFLSIDSAYISYLGGIRFAGNKLFGMAVSKEKGTVTIQDKNNRTRKIVLESSLITFEEDEIKAESSALSIYHNGDSITHPDVNFIYHKQDRILEVVRNNIVTPFTSNYFGFNLNVDKLYWDMNSNNIILNIANGKDIVAATFESLDFFNEGKYKKLGRFLEFHPINLVVNYARKVNSNTVYTGELASEYNQDERFIKGGAKLLHDYGFANFDEDLGSITLKELAYKYYDASGQKIDFDNLMIPSITGKKNNAIISLGEMNNENSTLGQANMKVFGVNNFYFTPDFLVYAKPSDSTITIFKDRKIVFDGLISANNLEFIGEDFEFDYNNFQLNLPLVNDMKLLGQFESEETGKIERSYVESTISNTSGLLSLRPSNNKSGTKENHDFPHFASVDSATVYYDELDALKGIYDKSIRFLLPPFDIHSSVLNEDNQHDFKGTFTSDGMFPDFQETLTIQPDRSLGFVHNIPKEGYNLYNSEAKTYEKISLNSEGIHGFGKIDFLSASIFSDDFRYYPDSVIADGKKGEIKQGEFKGVSFPKVNFNQFKMKWLPKEDNMRLISIDTPFSFYNNRVFLAGEMDFTSKGLRGKGQLELIDVHDDVKMESEHYHFEENRFGATNTSFDLIVEGKDEVTMSTKGATVEFNLQTNTSTIETNDTDTSLLAFPYVEMVTSLNKAFWDVTNKKIITIEITDSVELTKSFFMSTNSKLDSLSFNARKGTYYIERDELEIEGIPYIKVADSKIIPKNNKIIITKGSQINLEHARLIIDTLNGYHQLDEGLISIKGKDKFEGSAFYTQIINEDTFRIKFNAFSLEKVSLSEENEKSEKERIMTVSSGEVKEDNFFKISDKFQYKGKVKMYANNPALELKGWSKMIINNPNYDFWIPYHRSSFEKEIRVDLRGQKLENGRAVKNGILYHDQGDLYVSFVEGQIKFDHSSLFDVQGFLTYEEEKNAFAVLEKKLDKSDRKSQEIYYSNENDSIFFKGFINLFDESLGNSYSSGFGGGKKETNELSIDVMSVLDFPIPKETLEEMAIEIADLAARLGLPQAEDNNADFLVKLADLIDEKAADDYEKRSSTRYTALVDLFSFLGDFIVLTKTEMKWDNEQYSWYSTSPIGISNIIDIDINAYIDGFFEIQQKEGKRKEIRFFLQPAGGVWYFIEVSEFGVNVASSNELFNDAFSVTLLKKSSKNASNNLLTESDVLEFITRFRKDYLQIEKPYSLEAPPKKKRKTKVTEEEEDDDDDGF